jgi:hypothetical protein
MDRAYELVNEAEEYVHSQRLLSNVAEQSRKVLTIGLAVKVLAILFF